ncbi:MAG: twin-arginine translocase TatA/TatE family subunit [Natrialbaceae archaeon]|nr:twin-arginine translocase TatA/TatE family subunit [Natrialbaceae archaeon]
MAVDIAPLFIPGAPGGPELLIILFIAILLFGANKIPQLARSTGEAMGEFQKGREKVETELEEMRETGFDEATEQESTTEDATTVEETEPVEEPETETEEETN